MFLFFYHSADKKVGKIRLVVVLSSIMGNTFLYLLLKFNPYDIYLAVYLVNHP